MALVVSVMFLHSVARVLECPSSMARRSFLILVSLCVVAIACSSGSPPSVPPIASPAAMGTGAPRAVAYSADGSRLLFVSQSPDGCSLEAIDRASGVRALLRALPFCAAGLQVGADGSILLRSQEASLWLDASLEEIEPGGGRLLEVHDGGSYVRENDGVVEWMNGGAALKLGGVGSLRSPRIAPTNDSIFAIRSADSGEVLVRIDSDGTETDLTPSELGAIDSFAISPGGKEIVFSAEHAGGFDVGLVSSAGSEVRWIAPDRRNETMVSWAPRGNKVSYRIGTPGGVLIRTVHIPTSAQLLVDLGMAEVRQLAWDPKAEKFALLMSTPERSPFVRQMRYGGEEPEDLVPPVTSLGLDLQVLTGAGADSFVHAPRLVRYGHRYPLVVWLEPESLFAWNPARASLAAHTVGGTVITGRAAAELDEPFWKAVEALPWVDVGRIYVVSRMARATIPSPHSGVNLTLISPDSLGGLAGKCAEGSPRMPGNPRDDIESFAAACLERVLGDPSTDRD